MTADTRKVCFVVMGFGKKTDYESGRTLDLDATYDAIIQPAATEQGLRCIRSDEIMQSGVIDVAMYEMLLRAELVIADISTGNVNAVYELGVRHALRPNATIIMKEAEGKLYFDLNHVSTFQYEHLGKDIGAREAERAKRALRILIREVMLSAKPDSPVYTFLPKLQQPRLTDEEYAELLDETEEDQERLAGHMRAGESFTNASRHEDAAKAFSFAAAMKPGEPFIIQQLALATYKAKIPSELEALISGLFIINALDPDRSNDPETLGITGAMRKRLWLLTADKVQLDAAIRYYGRGFELRRDYYNGENLAICCDFRAKIQPDPMEAQYDRMTAVKTRLTLVEHLKELVQTETFVERSDRSWILATLANCLFALGDKGEAEKQEQLFFNEKPAQWELDTYTANKAAVLAN